LVIGLVVAGVILFAVEDHGPASLEPNGGSAVAAPCGGTDTVSDVVHASPVGGLVQVASLYDVEDVRVADSDPNWGRFSAVAKDDGRAGQFQNQYGVVHCVAGQWIVTDVGTVAVGCTGATAPPGAVRSDLDLSCPS